MPVSLATSMWGLPGPRQFLYRMGQDLLDGVSQVVLYPAEADSYGIKQELLRSIEGDCYLDVRVLDSGGEDGDGKYKDPYSLICSVFPDLNEYDLLERAIESVSLPDVIVIENLKCCHVEMQVAWLQILERWAQACQASGSRCSLLLLIPADLANELQLPPSNVRLSYLVWAGIPTALEMRLLCRMKTEGFDYEDQWREFLLASIAGNDIELCEYLWDVTTSSVSEIILALECFANRKKWNKEKLEALLCGWRPRPPGQDLQLIPKAIGFPLLSQGITVYTPEYGEEINSAVLATLGRKEEIEHRVWRAQAALLLPLIDEVRRRICDHMTAKYGPNWAVIDGNVFNPPLEWGKMKIFFEELSRQFPEKHQWATGIIQTGRIRNFLSHYKTISYTEFRDFWGLSVSVRENSINRWAQNNG